MSEHRHLAWGDGQLRVASWRGDEQTAYLVPARSGTNAATIETSVRALAEQGYLAAVTAALAPAEQLPFLDAGFTVHERLHLLTRPVDGPIPRPGSVDLRRGRPADRPAILAVDRAAFSDFWHLDEAGLDDAVAATPAARLRVASSAAEPGGVAGYAVTGRAGSRGYLQRLAVDPSCQRQGIATALVHDGLRWLKRWGAREVLVNTQEENAAALSLYAALGFQRQPIGLAVLRRSVVTPAP